MFGLKNRHRLALVILIQEAEDLVDRYVDRVSAVPDAFLSIHLNLDVVQRDLGRDTIIAAKFLSRVDVIEFHNRVVDSEPGFGLAGGHRENEENIQVFFLSSLQQVTRGAEADIGQARAQQGTLVSFARVASRRPQPCSASWRPQADSAAWITIAAASISGAGCRRLQQLAKVAPLHSLGHALDDFRANFARVLG